MISKTNYVYLCKKINIRFVQDEQNDIKSAINAKKIDIYLTIALAGQAIYLAEINIGNKKLSIF